MGIAIRPARPADSAVIIDFNARLAWETEEKRLDRAVLEAGVAEVLADPHKGFYTLAERGGEVVGQVLVTFEWSDWRNGWYWWIQSVYVREDARRGGIFRALFDHLHAQATGDPKVIGLRLYLERSNDRARQTYTALGLAEEGYDLMGLYPLPGRSSAIG
jgi:GNAT superfamily N-acetyltransferase